MSSVLAVADLYSPGNVGHRLLDCRRVGNAYTVRPSRGSGGAFRGAGRGVGAFRAPVRAGCFRGGRFALWCAELQRHFPVARRRRRTASGGVWCGREERLSSL